MGGAPLRWLAPFIGGGGATLSPVLGKWLGARRIIEVRRSYASLAAVSSVLGCIPGVDPVATAQARRSYLTPVRTAPRVSRKTSRVRPSTYPRKSTGKAALSLRALK